MYSVVWVARDLHIAIVVKFTLAPVIAVEELWSWVISHEPPIHRICIQCFIIGRNLRSLISQQSTRYTSKQRVRTQATYPIHSISRLSNDAGHKPGKDVTKFLCLIVTFFVGFWWKGIAVQVNWEKQEILDERSTLVKIVISIQLVIPKRFMYFVADGHASQPLSTVNGIDI